MNKAGTAAAQVYALKVKSNVNLIFIRHPCSLAPSRSLPRHLLIHVGVSVPHTHHMCKHCLEKVFEAMLVMTSEEFLPPAAERIQSYDGVDEVLMQRN